MLNFYKIINLKTWSDHRGTINILSDGKEFKFKIKRIYFFQNKMNNVTRGMHAQIKNHSIIVPITGTFLIKLRDKNKIKKIILNSKENKALYIKPKVWREIYIKEKKFSCFVLNSHFYFKKDYIFKLEHMK